MARVLVVDDSIFMRKMIRGILEKEGHNVIGEAHNGLKGFEMYKQLKPDITTMDITMEKMDGLASLKLIQSIDPNAKVVMCSAMGQQKLLIKALNLGAKDFVVKPFSSKKLNEIINNVLEESN